jgi:ABC-type multidrug transport system fused ATPase/permease subunit
MGNIFFDDMNSKDINIKSLREQIGFVSQDAILFSGTIEENITYGAKDYSY